MRSVGRSSCRCSTASSRTPWKCSRRCFTKRTRHRRRTSRWCSRPERIACASRSATTGRSWGRLRPSTAPIPWDCIAASGAAGLSSRNCTGSFSSSPPTRRARASCSRFPATPRGRWSGSSTSGGHRPPFPPCFSTRSSARRVCSSIGTPTESTSCATGIPFPWWISPPTWVGWNPWPKRRPPSPSWARWRSDWGSIAMESAKCSIPRRRRRFPPTGGRSPSSRSVWRVASCRC